MPVAAQRPYKKYTANGNTDTFPATFRFDKGEHLLVKVAGVLQELTTDYTTTGGDPTGDVVFNAGKLPAAGSKVEIQRDMPVSRETDYTATPFREPTVEADQDYQTQLLQILDMLARAGLRLPLDEEAVDTQLPGAAARAGKLLSFGGNGAPIMVAMPSGAPEIVVPVDATDGDAGLQILAANNPAARTMAIYKEDATEHLVTITPEAGTICRGADYTLYTQDDFIRITPNAALNNWVRIG